MDKSEYDLLMSELDSIAEKVTAFPPSMHEMVYRNIVDTLLAKRSRDRQRMGTPHDSFTVRGKVSHQRLQSYLARGAIELSDTYQQYNIIDASDMVYAAWVAHFLTDLAPPNIRKDDIDHRDLEAVSNFLERPIRNPKSTLNNSRRSGEYLTAVRPGRYVVSKKGREEIEKLHKQEGKE